MGVFDKLVGWLKKWFGKKPAAPTFPSPIPNAATITARLLQKSYLPNQRPAKDELPPVFSSETFTPKVARQIVSLLPKGPMGFDAVEYRLTRADGQIRAAYIPHPLPYANLVLVIERWWNNFPDIFNNYNSYIRPRLHSDRRLLVMKYDSWLTKTLKSLRWKLNSRYIAHADIANFFPSVYTHSLGWAAVGLQTAKKSNGKAWYDKLDKAYRLTKRNETNGVLIGPATSNFATEVILGKVDEKLSAKGYLFYRHIDDYKCYCSTKEDAESFLADLARFLSYYKLTINSRKSGIIALPCPDIDPWVAELRILARQLGSRPSSGQISFFLDQVTQVASEYSEPNAYKYAATVLKSKKLNQNSKVTAFIQVLGLSQFAPNLTSSLINFLPDKYHCNFHDIGQAVVARLRETVRFGRSDVTAWLIYLAHSCNEPIPSDLVTVILHRRDCIPAILLYATGDKITKKLVADVAKNAINSPDIYDAHSQWMLIYELYRVGALKVAGIDQPCFDKMKAADVTFCSLMA